tara:strand:+ start:216 stop:407 length:192 start_codon:yes stop_codon:yes gene_type:complete
MKYVVNLVNKRGINKVKYVEGTDIKDAQQKAHSQYPDWEVVRITPDQNHLDYYSLVKDLKNNG